MHKIVSTSEQFGKTEWTEEYFPDKMIMTYSNDEAGTCTVVWDRHFEENGWFKFVKGENRKEFMKGRGKNIEHLHILEMNFLINVADPQSRLTHIVRPHFSKSSKANCGPAEWIIHDSCLDISSLFLLHRTPGFHDQC